MLSRFVAVVVVLAAIDRFTPAVEPAPVPASTKISYFKDVRPIFQQHCQGCHQPAKAQGEYVLTEFLMLMMPGDSGELPIVAGKPEKSYLVQLIRTRDGKAEMPQNRDPLPTKQFELIEAWVRQGAIDDTPKSAKATVVDADNPPVYAAPPVITSLAYSPDGKLLAVTGYHEILLYKADGSGLVARLVGMSERVQSLAFSPDGKSLAAAAGDPGRFGEVQVWDVEKRRLKSSTPATFDTIYGISWSPDSQTLAFGCNDNTVRAIDATSGKQVLFMGTHSDWVLGTVFSQDGQHLVSVSRDMSVKLTEVATQRFIDNVTSITPGALKGGLMAVDRRPMKEKKMQKVPLDTPGVPPKVYDELIIAGSDGTPRLYKMHREVKREIGDDSNRIRQFEPLPGRVSSIKFDADGKRIAAASSLDGKGEVRVYEVDSAKKVAVCMGITSPIYAVAWRPDGGALASAGFDGKVWLHDPATGKLIKEFSVAPTATAKK